MERRPVQVHIAGREYRLVSTAPEADLHRFAAIVNAKVQELAASSRPGGDTLLLAALALAHDLEVERERRHALERRTRDLLRRALLRLNDVLDQPGEREVPE